MSKFTHLLRHTCGKEWMETDTDEYNYCPGCGSELP